MLRREYLLRLGTVALVLLMALVLIAAILLLPTYVFLIETARTKESRLANIESEISSSDEAALSARLDTLSRDATILKALEDVPSASALVQNILAVPRPGVTLSGFAYSPGTDKKPATFAVSGTAATRDALRTYQLALQGLPSVRSADLPISAYAKDADIAFTIAMTLVP